MGRRLRKRLLADSERFLWFVTANQGEKANWTLLKWTSCSCRSTGQKGAIVLDFLWLSKTKQRKYTTVYIHKQRCHAWLPLVQGRTGLLTCYGRPLQLKAIVWQVAPSVLNCPTLISSYTSLCPPYLICSTAIYKHTQTCIVSQPGYKHGSNL